jgi:hypothetical protein
MARPKKVIDAVQVQALAGIGCTVAEIAAVMDCSKDTLERRFAAFIEKGRERMKMSLRRHQMKSAENGNATMLIWLGKQYLGQSDKTEITGKDGGPQQYELTDGSARKALAGKLLSLAPSRADGEGNSQPERKAS